MGLILTATIIGEAVNFGELKGSLFVKSFYVISTLVVLLRCFIVRRVWTKAEWRIMLSVVIIALLIAIAYINKNYQIMKNFQNWMVIPFVQLIYGNKWIGKNAYGVGCFAATLILIISIVLLMIVPDATLGNGYVDNSDNIYAESGLGLKAFIFQSPHQASIFFSVLALFFIYGSRSKRGVNSIRYVGVLLSSMLMFLTSVRIGVMMLAATTFLSHLSDWKRVVGLLILVMGLLVLAHAFNPAVYNRYIEFSGSENIDDFLMAFGSGRFFIWQSYIDAVAQSHTAGWMFGWKNQEIQMVVAKNIDWNVLPHNGFIEVFVNCGIVGLALLLALFRNLLKDLKNKEAKIVFCVYSITNMMLQFVSPVFITMFYVYAIAKSREKLN